MSHFADRLAEATRRKGSAVCVGIDPRVSLLPQEFKPKKDTPVAHAESISAWGRALVEVVAPLVPVVKPQLAFFEALGSAGFRAYHEIVIAAQERGLLVIADAKRGDIGTTAQAYAEAHFEVVGADALTVNPYLGRDSIEPFAEYGKLGKGIFVLVKTSNPGSSDLQDLRIDGVPLHTRVARLLRSMSETGRGSSGQSHIGAVVGATHPQELVSLRAEMPHTPLLVPGYGAQGGTAADCAAAFLADGTGAVVNSSRGITFAFRSGDHASKYGESRWRDSVRAAVIDMRDALEAEREKRAGSPKGGR
jgi:orotidine-5'-phosphate decarboxylase